jgi:hypothetical protein
LAGLFSPRKSYLEEKKRLFTEKKLRDEIVDKTTEAELDLPMVEIAAAFSLSLEEMEEAFMSGKVQVEQEVLPPLKEGEWPDTVKLIMTMGEQEVAMPVTLHYPSGEENGVG